MLRLAALLVVCAATAGCGGTTAHRDATRHQPPRTRTTHTRPQPRPRRLRRHASPVPILEYHVIGFVPAGSRLEGLYVTPAELRAQVDWLAANGWHTVTLRAVARYWRAGIALPRKPVVLSFDDGYPGDWQYALPILHSRGFVGVLNLQIGNLVPLHVRQLLHGGWEIDSHTFTHPDLRAVGTAQLHHEIFDARFALERQYQVPVPAFCYPYGFYDSRVVAEVKRAGYELAETEVQGWASPAQGLLTLDRIRMTPSTGVAGLAAWLSPR